MELNSNFILQADHLSKNYGPKRALDNVSFSIKSGRIVGLLGPNGSGKTTLIKILAGMNTVYQGNVSIAGCPPGPDSKTLISYLPDKLYFPNWMKVNDIVEEFHSFFADFDAQKCYSMLQRLNVDARAKIKSLSKGTIEKLQLCLAMARNARLYLLDEPLGGVDPAARDFILDTILNNYSEHSTIVISTHLIADVERIFDTVIFLKDGQIALCDDVDNVRMKEGKSIDQLFREVFKC